MDLYKFHGGINFDRRQKLIFEFENIENLGLALLAGKLGIRRLNLAFITNKLLAYKLKIFKKGLTLLVWILISLQSTSVDKNFCFC